MALENYEADIVIVSKGKAINWTQGVNPTDFLADFFVTPFGPLVSPQSGGKLTQAQWIISRGVEETQVTLEKDQLNNALATIIGMLREVSGIDRPKIKITMKD